MIPKSEDGFRLMNFEPTLGFKCSQCTTADCWLSPLLSIPYPPSRVSNPQCMADKFSRQCKYEITTSSALSGGPLAARTVALLH